jgi:murein L,D-transpeptidase YafK
MRWRRSVPWVMAAAAVLLGAGYAYDKLLPGLLAENVPAADRVVVQKAERKLSLLRGGTVLKSYQISLGRDPVGPKQAEGDGRTPEGSYLIDWRNPRSRFHLALHISYPDENDRRQALGRGVPPGGDIMIHGRPNLLSWLTPVFTRRDWTDGCIAVSNREIEEIWRAVADGTPVDILP